VVPNFSPFFFCVKLIDEALRRRFAETAPSQKGEPPAEETRRETRCQCIHVKNLKRPSVAMEEAVPRIGGVSAACAPPAVPFWLGRFRKDAAEGFVQ